MKRFRNILVVVNGHESDHGAMVQALTLARSNESIVTVVSTVDEVPERGLRLLPGLEKALLEQARHRLEIFLGRYHGEARIHSKVLLGSPFLVVVREVLAANHDLLIKAPEDDGTTLPSSDMHLLRKCPCPVWLVRSPREEHPQLRRILVAVDPHPDDEAGAALNQDILKLGVSLALEPHATLHIVHAFGGQLTEGLLARLLPGQSQKYSEQARALAEADLSKLRADSNVDLVDYVTHLVEGDPSDVILEVANNNQVDLLVMGTIARSGIAGYFIGNTAERVLGRVRCSVLAVKPGGFKTPVSLV